MTSNCKEKKISFIVCTNDPLYAGECELYIHSLTVPDGYEVEVLLVEDARSMTSGYNEAMAVSDAKYKVYLHQDVMIYNRNFIIRILEIFQSDPSIGMIGMVGNTRLPDNAIHWSAGGVHAGGIYSDIIYDVNYRLFEENGDGVTDVVILDGLLMATQVDIPWREDLFTGWHFYDLSQSREFYRQGYRVVVPHMEEPWVFHDNDVQEIGEEYHRYRQIFLDEYGGELAG